MLGDYSCSSWLINNRHNFVVDTYNAATRHRVAVWLTYSTLFLLRSATVNFGELRLRRCVFFFCFPLKHATQGRYPGDKVVYSLLRGLFLSFIKLWGRHEPVLVAHFRRFLRESALICLKPASDSPTGESWTGSLRPQWVALGWEALCRPARLCSSPTCDETRVNVLIKPQTNAATLTPTELSQFAGSRQELCGRAYYKWIQNGGVPGTIWIWLSARLLFNTLPRAARRLRIGFGAALCPELYLQWGFGGLQQPGADSYTRGPSSPDGFLVSRGAQSPLCLFIDQPITG